MNRTNAVGVFKGTSPLTEQSNYLDELNKVALKSFLNKNEIKIYPNPANENITISYKLANMPKLN